MKRMQLAFLSLTSLLVACQADSVTSPKRIRMAKTVICESRREYSYDPAAGTWTDVQTGEVYYTDPAAPCGGPAPDTTLHYDKGQIVGFFAFDTIPAHDFTPAEQSSWSDDRIWVFSNGVMASYGSDAADQEVLYGSQELRDAIDLLRRGSQSFDNAMRAIENDPKVLLKVVVGFIADGRPAWTQDLGMNGRGQHVVLVTIDLGNVANFAADPYFQQRGGVNEDVVLAHEIYGHALGMFTSGCNEDCAIMRENHIRDEKGFPSRTF